MFDGVRGPFHALLSVLASAWISIGAADEPPRAPRIWVWAWDRPEDLRFLGPEDAGVAFYVLGVRIERSTRLKPRSAALKLRDGMHRIAVVRIDMEPSDVTDSRLREVTQAIRRYALVPGIEGLQLDFDATRSQRPFYRRLLEQLARDPKIKVPLTITALASWCMGDHWIADLPVAGAVAMLFEMGPEAEEALGWLSKGRPLGGVGGVAPAWGLGTNQSLPVGPPANGRIFLFHPRSWSPTAFQKALRLVHS